MKIIEKTFQNAAIENQEDVLNKVLQKDINIAIYNRDIIYLKSEINDFVNQGAEFRERGSLDKIYQSLNTFFQSLEIQHKGLLNDIKHSLLLFDQLTQAKTYSVLLATVNTNMCRRFHTDMNDLRMLCTYSGPGTLWLTEDNINRKALHSIDNNENIAINESKIQQAKTGSIVILKGAIYPIEGTKAIVHRSPTIEETGEKRLLLRIDTQNFLGFLMDTEDNK